MSKSVNSVLNIGRIFRALGYSWRGLQAAYVQEAAFRQELLACALLVPAALFLGTTLFERMLLIASLVFVLVVEILNSAIEALVDWHGEAPHPLAGRAKDMGSAAVLLAMIVTLLLWVAVLMPHYQLAW